MSQLNWFEHNQINFKKLNRYAKVNLEEVFNYEEKLVQFIAHKKTQIKNNEMQRKTPTSSLKRPSGGSQFNNSSSKKPLTA
jgi:hypothetical protein